jgi:predicted small lipoprotein YifL
MKHWILCIAAILPLAMTTACGQKGPLYLPPKNGTVVTRPAAPPPAPSTTSESAPSDTLKQDPGPATRATGADKSNKDNPQTPPK